jgi:hypothetical protein
VTIRSTADSTAGRGRIYLFAGQSRPVTSTKYFSRPRHEVAMMAESGSMEAAERGRGVAASAGSGRRLGAMRLCGTRKAGCQRHPLNLGKAHPTSPVPRTRSRSLLTDVIVVLRVSPTRLHPRQLRERVPARATRAVSGALHTCSAAVCPRRRRSPTASGPICRIVERSEE